MTFLRSHSRNWQSWNSNLDLLESCLVSFEPGGLELVPSLLQLPWSISYAQGTVLGMALGSEMKVSYLWVGMLSQVFKEDRVVPCQGPEQRQWENRGGRGNF